MANELDELTGTVNENGQDINVISKQLKPKVGVGTWVFVAFLFITIIPGIFYLILRIKKDTYFKKLQQRIQHGASEIDNYLDQRVQVLQNLASIVKKSAELDKDVFKSVAASRAGLTQDANGDTVRNERAAAIDSAYRGLTLAVENYPDLKAHESYQKAIDQNLYLQREITAARTLYNDIVSEWNSSIYEWPLGRIIANKNSYTTRIPFSISKETKERARSDFFAN